ncbi:MAG: GLUG motif-containing protein [Rhizomicrobium sp.]
MAQIIGKTQSACLLIGALLLSAASANASVEISANATKNMNCTAGVCTPTAKNAVLNVTDLANMLASDDTTIKSTSQNLDIDIQTTLSWISTSRLTLYAYQSIEIEKPVTVAGTGAMTLITNEGGTGGDVIFNDKGNVTFWDLASSLVINGSTYVLVDDIDTLSAAIANNPKGDYALANNFDAGKKTYRGSPISTIFYGQFEGLGNSISNLSIKDVIGNQQQDYEGFFSWITSGATVENLNLLHVKMSTKSPYANEVMGALIGYNQGSVINNIVSGKIDGSTNQFASDYVGGLVGRNEGSITRSRSSAKITYGDVAGGLVGVNYGMLSDSSASGAVDSAGNAGGLTGDAGAGQGVIANSFATGAVSNSKVPSWLEGFLGGLVGSNGGKVLNSFATGSVTEFNTSTAGGLFGHNEAA